MNTDFPNISSLQTSKDFLKHLFEHIGETRGTTINQASAALGINSRGYLYEVLSGKRRLGLRYLPKLQVFFGLNDSELEILNIMLKLEGRAISKSEQQSLEKRLAGLKLTVSTPKQKFLDGSQNKLLLAKVFCTLGTMPHGGSATEIANLLGPTYIAQIRGALNWLKDQEMIEQLKGDESASKFLIKQSTVFFNRSETGMSHLDFIKLALNDASENVSYWFEQAEHSCMQSFLISIKKQKLEGYIKTLKKRIMEDLVELSDDHGDQLIHFNIQVYPALKESK